MGAILNLFCTGRGGGGGRRIRQGVDKSVINLENGGVVI